MLSLFASPIDSPYRPSPICSQPSFAELSSVMRFIVASGIILPLTYGIATLLYHFVEKPGIKLGKMLISRSQTKAVALR